MAEPTLKDVLKALAALGTELRADIAKVDAKVDAVKSEVAAHRAETKKVDAKVDAVKSEVVAHRAETKKGFADLEAEAEAHAESAHRDIDRKLDKHDKDIAALQGRPATRPARRTRASRGR